MTDTIIWAGASNGGQLSSTDTGAAVLTPDGLTIDPALYSALVGPVVPGVLYELTANLTVPSGWSVVQTFAAFFGADRTYAGSGVYPAGFAQAAGVTTPTTLQFAVPGDGLAVYVQCLLQLTGSPDSTIQLQVSDAAVGPVPVPEGTVVHSGLLASGRGLVVLPDRWSYLTVSSLGPDALYATTTGVPAEVGGDDNYCVPGGTETVVANELPWWHPGSPGCDGTTNNPGTIISLSSAGPAAAYSIAAAG